MKPSVTISNVEYSYEKRKATVTFRITGPGSASHFDLSEVVEVDVARTTMDQVIEQSFRSLSSRLYAIIQDVDTQINARDWIHSKDTM